MEIGWRGVRFLNEGAEINIRSRPQIARSGDMLIMPADIDPLQHASKK